MIINKFWQDKEVVYDFRAEINGTGSQSCHCYRISLSCVLYSSSKTLYVYTPEIMTNKCSGYLCLLDQGLSMCDDDLDSLCASCSSLSSE